MLAALADGPDDPSRYLVDRMIATLPDGTVRTIASGAAPYVAAYLNARLADIAPRLVPGLAAISGGLARIASHVGTLETLGVDGGGAAVRTLTAVRFEVGAAPVLVHLADAGLMDLERLVGNSDVVLVIELAQQVGDRLDPSTGQTGDHREEQAARCDGTEPFTLSRSQAQLVDVLGGQRARAHPAS